MPSTTENCPGELPVSGGMEEALHLLAEQLRSAREEVRRQRRRAQVMVLALASVLAAAVWTVLPPRSIAETRWAGTQAVVAATPEDSAGRRADLLGMLPADTQRELEAFEREVDWVNRYMQTWEEGKAGAVVAIMLYRMAQNMSTMPAMEQQMRAMTGQMGALPAIVAELSQINAKMHVITATMDSTMGRAGRMMPWMPFAP